MREIVNHLVFTLNTAAPGWMSLYFLPKMHGLSLSPTHVQKLLVKILTLQPFLILLFIILLSGCWEWEADGGV